MPIRMTEDGPQTTELCSAVRVGRPSPDCIDLKDQLASDRSDGVRSSSRHVASSQLALAQCSEIACPVATCVTIEPRSDPTSSRCETARARRKRRSSMTGAERHSLRTSRNPRSGGARRDRTDDLLLAKQALSQLSYGPVRGQATGDRGQISLSAVRLRLIMVGLGRFELPTSRLSSARSNQLSYKPWGQETAISHQKSATARLPSEPVYRPPISDP